MSEQLEDPARVAYDGMAPRYDALVAPHAFYPARVRRFLRRHWRPGKRVLDLGCGTGLMTRDLPDHDVVGLDLSPGMLEAARAIRPNRVFAVHDFHQPVPAALGSFDVVLCISCLEFCRDLPGLFRNVAGALQPGGVALLTPVHRSPGSARRELASPKFPGLLLHSYRPAEVAAAVAASGLQRMGDELGRGWRGVERVYWYGYWQVRKPGAKGD